MASWLDKASMKVATRQEKASTEMAAKIRKFLKRESRIGKVC